MKNYRIGQNILPTEWHFVKSAKMAVYPPYKNPVFPPLSAHRTEIRDSHERIL